MACLIAIGAVIVTSKAAVAMAVQLHVLAVTGRQRRH
jgi:hypothetical protein